MISASNRIVSFWEMLEKLEAAGLVNAITVLSSTAKLFMSLQHKMDIGRRGSVDLSETGGAVSGLQAEIPRIEVIERVASQLAMAGVLVTAANTKRALGEIAALSRPIARVEVLHAHTHIHALLLHFGNEMEGRKLFVMDPKWSGYYEPKNPLFGEAVADAFQIAPMTSKRRASAWP